MTNKVQGVNSTEVRKSVTLVLSSVGIVNIIVNSVFLIKLYLVYILSQTLIELKIDMYIIF